MSEAITEKVRKLLRLARCKGATPAEAANALNRALELIEKHRIDMADLNLDEETERLVCENIDAGSRLSIARKLAINLVERHFHVKIILVPGSRSIFPNKLSVVGFEHDVTFALYAFDFICRACSQSQKEWAIIERKARRRVSGAKRENFVRGWMYGLSSSLRKPTHDLEDGSKTALALSSRRKRVEDHFSDLFPKVHSTKLRPVARRNRAALEAGFLSGQNTTIHKPLAGGQAQGTLFLE